MWCQRKEKVKNTAYECISVGTHLFELCFKYCSNKFLCSLQPFRSMLHSSSWIFKWNPLSVFKTSPRVKTFNLFIAEASSKLRSPVEASALYETSSRVTFKHNSLSLQRRPSNLINKTLEKTNECVTQPLILTVTKNHPFT